MTPSPHPGPHTSTPPESPPAPLLLVFVIRNVRSPLECPTGHDVWLYRASPAFMFVLIKCEHEFGYLLPHFPPENIPSPQGQAPVTPKCPPCLKVPPRADFLCRLGSLQGQEQGGELGRRRLASEAGGQATQTAPQRDWSLPLGQLFHLKATLSCQASSW